ncbi:TetR/AcrR family transcriptional regulator [Nonomuraea fuscirosea]|uniref:TetR/AcrR family transcriptional regulator n=1 Tax=Nonomuraea fuscirosea TaxID=1291556 RepID=UPI00343F30D6
MVTSEQPGSRSSGGAWERKRARTKQAIQRHALRLFGEQGYHATTVEQVAAAADLAPSTVFRYFPTKHDLVVLDDDLLMIRPFIAAFREQPPELGVLAALHNAVRTAFDETGAARSEHVEIQDRARLVVTIPEVWAANMDSLASSMRGMAELFAERAGRDATDPEILSLTRMLCGSMTMAWLAAGSGGAFDLPAVLEETVARLRTGFQL